MFRNISLVEAAPLKVPDPKPGIATEGYMALSRSHGDVVYGRGVPENTIFRGRLVDNQLRELQLVLSRELYPLSEDGREVVGYEDPTCLWNGIYCTQTVAKLGPGPDASDVGLDTNLVWSPIDSRYNSGPLVTVMTPSQAMAQGLGDAIDMIKEAEPIDIGESDIEILFEYGDIATDPPSSNIGMVGLDQGLQLPRPFYTAQQDGSEHVSTAGAPIGIVDPRRSTQLLFFNRRRAMEWGIAWMLIDEEMALGPVYACDDWLIRASPSAGLGPHNQLIAFGSCATRLTDELIEILYHVNDNSCWRAVVQLS